MPVFRSIVVACDFSERSREAFRVACSLAEETKTRLFVVHVAEPEYLPGQAVAFGEFGMPVSLPAGGADVPGLTAKLRDFYAPNRPLDVDYRVREGEAVAVLLHEAGEVGADLIVLGTHGRKGLGRLLMGSVAEAVLRRAHCPVMALRSSGEGPVDVEEGVILYATDLTEYSEDAFRAAKRMARDRGARLMILHVIPAEPVFGAVPMPVDMPEYKSAIDAYVARAEGPEMKYPVGTSLRRGVVAEEVLGAAEELGARLVVLGTHGRSALGRLFLGSTAEAVLRKSKCPVLVVKPTGPLDAGAGKSVDTSAAHVAKASGGVTII